jgi:pimeloyl-ACP methyl ester carboxylesterase
MKTQSVWMPLLFRAFPGASARYLAKQFLTPRTRLTGLEQSSKHRVPLRADGMDVVVHIEGSGPLVILAHGWAGSGGQFSALKPLLLENGFRVAAFDAPGHGSSPGKFSNAGQFARLIAAIHREHGPTLTVIGHSLGGLAAAMTVPEVRPRGMVLVCPMPSFEFALDQYQSHLSFGAGVKERIARRVEDAVQVKREFGKLEPALESKTPTLLIHDETDRVVPVSASRELRQRYPHIQYLETHNLGHSRLLRDSQVHQQILSFVRSLS